MVHQGGSLEVELLLAGSSCRIKCQMRHNFVRHSQKVGRRMSDVKDGKAHQVAPEAAGKDGSVKECRSPYSITNSVFLPSVAVLPLSHRFGALEQGVASSAVNSPPLLPAQLLFSSTQPNLQMSCDASFSTNLNQLTTILKS